MLRSATPPADGGSSLRPRRHALAVRYVRSPALAVGARSDGLLGHLRIAWRGLDSGARWHRPLAQAGLVTSAGSSPVVRCGRLGRWTTSCEPSTTTSLATTICCLL